MIKIFQGNYTAENIPAIKF